MADEEPKGEDQLMEQETTEEPAEQVDNQTEDAEKQDETTTTEPSTEKDEVTTEANANDQDEAQDTPETKDTDHDPTVQEEEVSVEEPSTPSFPKTLEGFGYKFNDSGQLRQIENNEPFVFKVKESDQQYNQLHYEALGEVITEHIYQLLESDVNLTRTDIPIDVKSDEAHSFIFESGDARTAEKLMVLIHGSGVVRAGQWARRLIINDCLDSGTQLPFIKRSFENSYGVLVLNTNRNSDIVNGEALPVRGSESAEQHTLYVWDHVISKCEAKQIDIVAHSYGGVAVLHLLAHRFDEVKDRVAKIAFTDSAHNVTRGCPNRPDIVQWISEHAVNWVSSDQPLDTVIVRATDDAGRLSAGTKKHEETSWCSFASIFKFFNGEEDYIQMVTKSEEPVTKTEDKAEGDPITTKEPVTKNEDEPVTKTEPPFKTENEPITKTEEEPVTKTEEEPVTKTEEEPVTKTEEEPVTKTEEEPVTKTEEEPVIKSEEPVPKTKEPHKDIDKRVEDSGHHIASTKSSESHPDVEQGGSCCIII